MPVESASAALLLMKTSCRPPVDSFSPNSVFMLFLSVIPSNCAVRGMREGAGLWPVVVVTVSKYCFRWAGTCLAPRRFKSASEAWSALACSMAFACRTAWSLSLSAASACRRAVWTPRMDNRVPTSSLTAGLPPLGCGGGAFPMAAAAGAPGPRPTAGAPGEAVLPRRDSSCFVTSSSRLFGLGSCAWPIGGAWSSVGSAAPLTKPPPRR
mmetsp:Transcript_33961/g.76491  ORF Transcript_33961/g.76491 Transcript_33961/m.76491 type:complete len:210 (-) Transcript_33961:1426-2055(-)